MISRVDGVELGGGGEVATGVESRRARLAIDVGAGEEAAGLEWVLAHSEVDDLVEGLSTHAEHVGTISKGVFRASVA